MRISSEVKPTHVEIRVQLDDYGVFYYIINRLTQEMVGSVYISACEREKALTVALPDEDTQIQKFYEIFAKILNEVGKWI